MTEGRAAARRGAWALGDQAVSSLTNFIMSFALLSVVSIEAFGAFTIAFTTFTLLAALVRGAVSETLGVRFSDVAEREWRQATAAATGATILLSLAGAVAVAASGLIVGGAAGGALLALAVALPGLLLQNTWRFAFFVAGTPGRAFANDTVFGTLQVAAVLAVAAQGTENVAAYVLAWGAAGAVGGVFGMAQAGVLPAPTRAWAWVRRHSDLSGRYVAETAISRGTTQMTFVAIGAIAGLEALGRMSGARVLLGPVNVIYVGFIAIGIPEGVRLWKSHPTRLPPAARATAVILGGLALVVGAVLLAIPTDVGERLLDNWSESMTYLIPMAGYLAATGVVQAMIVGLRSLAAARRSLRAQIIASLLTAAGGVGGAVIAGGWGAAVGLVVALAAAAAVVWLEFEREAKERLTALRRGR